MKFVKIKQVDAFTRIPFSGNAADVVTAASRLTVKQNGHGHGSHGTGAAVAGQNPGEAEFTALSETATF